MEHSNLHTTINQDSSNMKSVKQSFAKKTKRKPLKYYPSINGLRAISILVVILHHLEMKNHLFHDVASDWSLPILSMLVDGHMGVNVFFVISGFLITSLLIKEESKTGGISLKNFFIRRTLRIFPAYFFMLGVYFLLQMFGVLKLNTTSWITSLTYTKYFSWWQDWVTSHGWSLSIEEHFYLFWPLLFIGGPNFRKYAAIGLTLFAPAIRIFDYIIDLSIVNELTIFTRIDSIALGCVFAIYKDEILDWIEPRFSLVFVSSLAVLFTLRYLPDVADSIYPGASIIFVPLGLSHDGLEHIDPNSPFIASPVTHGLLANIAIAFIMMYSVFGPKNLWFKFLNLPIMNSIGILSYSIYLWQQLFIGGFTSDGGVNSGPFLWLNDMPVNIIIVIIIANFSFYVIEKPFLKLKDKFHTKK